MNQQRLNMIQVTISIRDTLKNLNKTIAVCFSALGFL